MAVVEGKKLNYLQTGPKLFCFWLLFRKQVIKAKLQPHNLITYITSWLHHKKVLLGLIWVFWKLMPTCVTNILLANLVPQYVVLGITELHFNTLVHFTYGYFHTYTETFAQVSSCLQGFCFKMFFTYYFFRQTELCSSCFNLKLHQSIGH